MQISCRGLTGVAVAVGSMLLASCTGNGYEPIPETGASVTGTVKYKGQPVQAALVIAAGKAGGGTSDIGPDGRYSIGNAPLGEVRFGVNTSAVKGKMMGDAMSKAMSGGPDAKAQKVVPPKLADVPAKYGDPNTSGIKTTVNKGENIYDIVID